jgi:hypothetical protein
VPPPISRRVFAASLTAAVALPDPSGPRPRIAGDWTQIAGNPDLGKLGTEKQQVVDFAVWQALDGTWQAWSCIRHTAEPGATRLFYRWQGPALTAPDWEPMGIAMRAEPAFGERQGSMQAPFVMKIGDRYNLFYTSGGRAFVATGYDGKTFAREMTSPGKFGVFDRFEGAAEQKVIGGGGRDIMILHDGGRYIAYYTANPDGLGKVYARESKDLRQWTEPKVVAFGGSSGTGPYSAECPFVVKPDGTPFYFLFRTQRYANVPETRVYRSEDPLQFGIEDDSYLVAQLPVAAPEIVTHEGRLYMVALTPDVKGLRVARLEFA